ncbi:MAG: IS1595 family transposase [Reyranella sp.]|nr:IS1595 family transposase [Reyranella sp.]MBN9085476.1 IS1595 family transposase [Reyranella sp.]
MAKPKPMTIRQFFAIYPDDDVCLDHVMRARYGERHICDRCKKSAHYYRIKARQAYECEYCGLHLYPCVGTPFHKSRTPLQYWFFAMYLFCASRNGVAAKELQRQLGVTYKCAFRMGHKIREFMAEADGNAPLGGLGNIVEADETFIGGKDKLGEDDKHIVIGAVERGGEVQTDVVPDRRGMTVLPKLRRMLVPGARVVTDDNAIYDALPTNGYPHASVNHSKGEYVRGPIHTNTIEAFWAQLKRGINGTYIHVSQKHLDKYLGEFEYRFNLRKQPYVMFEILLWAFRRPSLVPSRV